MLGDVIDKLMRLIDENPVELLFQKVLDPHIEKNTEPKGQGKQDER